MESIGPWVVSHGSDSCFLHLLLFRNIWSGSLQVKPIKWVGFNFLNCCSPMNKLHYKTSMFTMFSYEIMIFAILKNYNLASSEKMIWESDFDSLEETFLGRN